MFCKQCGKELKEGAAFCSNCGCKIENVNNTSKKEENAIENHELIKDDTVTGDASVNTTAVVPPQDKTPYEAPREGQERTYIFKANQHGYTIFHLTHDTLVINQSGNPDYSKVICIPYCIITRASYETRKIFPALLIIGFIVLLFFLLMLGFNTAETNLGVSLAIHGIRIILIVLLVFCILNCRRTELSIMAGNNLFYSFDVNPVKNDKEKEWEKMYDEIKQLMHMERSEEEKKNNIVLTGTIQKDTTSNGMELLAHLEENAKRNKEAKANNN